jgi:hypothetical protein
MKYKVARAYVVMKGNSRVKIKPFKKKSNAQKYVNKKMKGK